MTKRYTYQNLDLRSIVIQAHPSLSYRKQNLDMLNRNKDKATFTCKLQQFSSIDLKLDQLQLGYEHMNEVVQLILVEHFADLKSYRQYLIL